MIDTYLLRNEPVEVAKKLALRGFKLDVNKLCALEDCRKTLQVKTENLQAERNSKSRIIANKIAQGEDVDASCTEVNKLSKELDKTKLQLELIRSEILDITLAIPNIPDDSVPIGKGENCNIEIKRWGVPKEFNFKIRDHITLGKMHGGIDFAAAVKLTGSRFIVMKNQIARLHRALVQFMLELHTEHHGYNEIYVPYLVNRNTLYGSGQLPKFADDLFHIKKELKKSDYALIPTAEVPLVNLVRNEIIDEDSLPIKMTAHSPCFRSEAGSYGRDSSGLIRTYQFDKVELVQIVRPEDSMDALEEITRHAEKVLELLGLPYRRVILCTGDMSFGSCKTYDLEVWIPAQNMYREISSCSNVWDFQARRMHTRYRRNSDKKTCLVHTLNGSGLAVGRTLVAVLENYQQINGHVKIPEILRPYMNGMQYIS